MDQNSEIQKSETIFSVVCFDPTTTHLNHRGRMVLEETVTNTKRDRDIQRHLVVVLVISSYSVLTPDRIAIKKKFLSIRNRIIIICPICA